MFIAEAPGRLGADRTCIPLSGDQTGANFDERLKVAQLHRSAIFITNAVLRNPRDDLGHNDSPTPEEVSNCSEHLAETLNIVQSKIVVTLGRKALDAVGMIAPHNAQLARDVGKPSPWKGRILIPLYHPSPQARRHRSPEQQKEDFRQLGEYIRRSL
jgi:DNA polymerase